MATTMILKEEENITQLSEEEAQKIPLESVTTPHHVLTLLLVKLLKSVVLVLICATFLFYIVLWLLTPITGIGFRLETIVTDRLSSHFLSNISKCFCNIIRVLSSFCCIFGRTQSLMMHDFHHLPLELQIKLTFLYTITRRSFNFLLHVVVVMHACFWMSSLCYESQVSCSSSSDIQCTSTFNARVCFLLLLLLSFVRSFSFPCSGPCFGPSQETERVLTWCFVLVGGTYLLYSGPILVLSLLGLLFLELNKTSFRAQRRWSMLPKKTHVDSCMVLKMLDFFILLLLSFLDT
jgi:hypothetical protein